MNPERSKSLEGVRVSRRLALHSAVALPALWMLSRSSSAGARLAKEGNEIEDLLERWTERTAKLVLEENPDEDAHLFELCADLSGVDPSAFPERSRVTYDKGGMKSGPIHVGMPFIVIQFDLEPRAVIPAHNHVGWGFASMGVRGEATVRNFEVFGDAPEPGQDLETTFKAREVSSAVLYPGRTSSLTRSRANIHWFKAGDEGATFLDFGVRIGKPGDGPEQSSSMEFDATPIDVDRRIHEARWLGDLYK